ncbi:acyltransferase [Agreia sp. COWG]|uniref:acyltransferase family protein n=1 Tax=Agreia sp. COWG TaxID=2773266 RepID=UPI0019278A2E|nr:acyltransferase [Agreia sp. COWG]CAD5991216.1 Peptidoglycan/LPS O-acetylase OafA/YrhL, contains acyltransferase and SGNH-hydrolase domains [Agreia sp. COWG]
MKTIGDVFDPARNSLNGIRLVLAAAVIVSHSWLVNGIGLPPMLNGTDPGLVAVAGFFAISGYLVTASRLRSRSLLSFLWRRFLRIYPAFLAALVVVAFVLAPLSTLIDPNSSIDWLSGLTYVLTNAGLFVQQTTVEHTLVNNPFPFVWNIPLWTLFYEALCYVVIGVLVSLLPRRMLGVTLAMMLVAATVVSLTFRLSPGAFPAPILDNATSLGSFFIAGALLFLYRDKVPASGLLAALTLALAVTLALAGLFKPLAAVPVAYLMLCAGSRLPAAFTRVGRRNDISYGMYVYGFPVQQLTILVLGGAVLPVWLFALVCVVVTVPFAWLSWLLIEKPVLRGYRTSARERAPIHVAP